MENADLINDPPPLATANDDTTPNPHPTSNISAPFTPLPSCPSPPVSQYCAARVLCMHFCNE